MTTFLGKRRYQAAWIGALALAYSIYLHFSLGMDGFWDTANYHLFIGWAASEFSPYRFGAAAQYQTYLNPLVDIVNYQAFSIHPFVGAAFHSLALSLTLVFLYFLASDVCKEKSDAGNPIFSLWAVAIGATGALTVSLFGSFTNEHITALFLILALWLAVDFSRKGNFRTIFLAGLFAGIAVGLKFTATPCFIGLLLSIALTSRFDRRTLFHAVGGAIVGVLATDGVFMLLRWQETGSPVFPLANNIFRSPLYPAEWKSFSKFEPHADAISYYLLLPVRWLYAADFSENNTLRDGRLLLAYAGLAMLAASAILRKERLSRQEVLVACFFVFSWLLWLVIARLYRYLVTLELLSGIVFLVGLRRLFPATALARNTAAMLFASVFLWVVTVYPDWGRRDWRHDFATSEIREKLPKNAAVVFFADERLSYLAPELHSMGIRFANLWSQPWYEGDRKGGPIDRVALTVPDKGKTYFLQYSREDPRTGNSHLEKAFGDSRYACTELKTSMIWNPLLCHFESLAEMPAIELGYAYGHDSDGVFFSSGWSSPERNHRWSEGKQSTIWFSLPKQAIDCRPTVVIRGHTLGKQHLELRMNGRASLVEELEGPFEVAASMSRIDVPGGKPVRLDFDLPDAFKPANGDPRVLGLALRSLKVRCD